MPIDMETVRAHQAPFRAIIAHLTTLLERPGLTAELAQEIAESIAKAEQAMETIDTPQTMQPVPKSADVALLKQLVALNAKADKAIVVLDERALEAKRAAVRSAYKMSPLPTVMAEAIHIRGFAWRWGQPDRNGVVLEPRHFYKTLRDATWLPLTDRHEPGLSIGRAKVIDNGIGLAVDAYLDPAHDFKSAGIQNEVYAGHRGFSIQYDRNTDGSVDLFEVALTPQPAHAGARILAVGR